MRRSEFIQALQLRTGVAAVVPSTVRNQGGSILRPSREFLGAMDLTRVPRKSPKHYRAWLDSQTEALLDAIRIRKRPWGTARKVLNIFMRDVLYNQYLRGHFRVGLLEEVLEVPLDSAVAKGLKKLDFDRVLPKWPGLKHLCPSTSDVYQAIALAEAGKQRIARVHLDVPLWLENR